MPKQGKKYRAAFEKVEPGRKYTLEEGLAKLREIAFAKFDETVELPMWLGVDPRKADQLVRGTVVLPHGVGRKVRVLVIAQGEKVKEAEEAGADFVGGEDMVNQIKGGWLDFEVEPAALYLVDHVLAAYEVGPCLLGLLDLLALRDDEHAHFPADAVRQNDRAAHQLVGLARVNAQPHGEFDRLVELREGDLPELRQTLFERVLPARLNFFESRAIFLSLLRH